MIIKYIIFTAALCFSVFGLAEFMHGIRLRLTSPTKRAVTYSVVILSNDDPEKQMLSAAEKRLWRGNAYADFIVAVNTGIDPESDRECKLIAEKYGIAYCTAEELAAEFCEYIPFRF